MQKRLKPEFVDCGLMIGQFYPGCEEGGIRNPQFRPLDAPVISLAVRYMALADAPFMLDDARYQAAFSARYGVAGEREMPARRGHDFDGRTRNADCPSIAICRCRLGS